MGSQVTEASKVKAVRSAWRWTTLVFALALMLASGAAIIGGAPLAAQDAAPEATATAAAEEEGYTYTVVSGDSWGLVSQRTGVAVADLQAANPQAVRVNDWLVVGEELFIPAPSTQQREIYTVRAGDSWNSIALRYDIRAQDLRDANPALVRPGLILYRGDRVLIPDPDAPVEAPTAEVTEEATAEPEAEATEAPTEEAAEEAAAEATETPTAEAAPEVTEEATAEAEATETPTEEAAPEATEEATAEATETPTEEATEEATPEPTAVPDEEPTAAAPEEPTPEATEEPAEEAAPPEIYTVGPGESWNSIALTLDVDAEALQAANPDLIRPGLILRVGDEIVLPAPGSELIVIGEAVTATVPLTDGAVITAEILAVPPAPGCPAAIGDYPEQLLAQLNEGGIEAATSFLRDCGALRDDSVTVGDLTGDGVDDLLLIYADPTLAESVTGSDLLILNREETGYTLGHRARAAGDVRLLATEDINIDGQADVVWTDTTCGASTCFDTVYVRSWTGDTWADWTDGAITMAYPEISLEESSEAGQGREIVLRGGVYGSVGAGPQRSRTEIWGSVAGAPYSQLEQAFEANNCLYFTVLDANTAFAAGTPEGLSLAEALYTEALGNEDLTQCWVRPDELSELRSFSYFQLALLGAYQDIPEVAEGLILALEDDYPDSVYADVGRRWLDVYADANDVAAACDEIVDYATENPAVTEVLSDYGYANPSFTAQDLCPALELAQPVGAAPDAEATPAAPEEGATEATPSPTEEAAEEGATEAIEEVAPTAVPTEEATEETTEQSTDGTVASAAVIATEGVTETDTITDTITDTVAAPAATPNPLGDCPADLAGYAAAFPAVISAAGGNAAAVEGWMRDCGALSDARGAILLTELNGDDLEDAVIFPTIVSDIGFGPEGSQGAVLVYHANAEGGLDLVLNPPIYGQPAPLKVDDLNDDGQVDVAWSVESCSISCVLEVQMLSWNGEVYTTTIEPGATIAEGTASFAPVGPNDPGRGQELLLEGGVSKAPEGGLAVPHTERWQSIAGGKFQRIDWQYDRESEGADCMGLRLVEADIALHAASLLGYEPAIERYTASLTEPFNACSIFGMTPEDEIVLLQGLANFRLIQALALSQELEAAQTTLDNLVQSQPEGPYTAAAQQWLESYAADGDPNAACDLIQPIFDENDALWLITDQFGFNHPALAAEQICYRPVQ